MVMLADVGDAVALGKKKITPFPKNIDYCPVYNFAIAPKRHLASLAKRGGISMQSASTQENVLHRTEDSTFDSVIASAARVGREETVYSANAEGRSFLPRRSSMMMSASQEGNFFNFGRNSNNGGSSTPAAANSSSSMKQQQQQQQQQQHPLMMDGGMLESQVAENRILRQKLESKAQALLILSRELERLRREGEDYRELTERLQGGGGFRGGASSQPLFRDTAAPGFAPGGRGGGLRDRALSRQFSELRDENRRLLSERQRLRSVLEDREEDVKALREEIARSRSRWREGHHPSSSSSSLRSEVSDLVSRLESLQQRHSQSRRDLQSLLDEREDLAQERDAYKAKVHRLNFAMAALLKSDGFQAVDMDWILAENKFLRDSVSQLQEEKQLANDMGKRYKLALENAKKPPRTTGALSSSRADSSSQEHKQQDRQVMSKIATLMGKSSFPCPADVDLSSPHSLRELCLSLLETLGDRMTQLRHQRGANRHIAMRMSELEDRVRNLENGDLLLAPAQHLMKGYSAAAVDDATAAEEGAGAGGGGGAEALLNQVRERLSSSMSSSSGASNRQPLTGEAASPEMADLYQKFRALSSPSEGSEQNQLAKVGDGEEGSSSSRTETPSTPKNPPAPLPPPPDIIANGMPMRHDVDKEEEEEGKVEDPIVLPPHLQSLVDKAMEDIVSHSASGEEMH